jgi:surface-anchored protein
MWHGPERGPGMRLRAARTAKVAVEPKPSPDPSPWRNGVRRKLIPLAVAAAVLAIPAMVISSVQPWRDAGLGSVTTDSPRGSRDGTIAASWQPEPTTEPKRLDMTTAAAAPGEPGARARGSAGPTPGPRNSVPPASPKAGKVAPLVATAELVGARPVAGSPASFEVTWRSGAAYFGQLTYTTSDGGSGGFPDETKSCRGAAPSGGDTRRVPYTFTQPGVKTITFTLSTYTCDGKQESAQATVTVDVAPAPTPAPAPKPAPKPMGPAPKTAPEPSGPAPSGPAPETSGPTPKPTGPPGPT